MSTMPHDVHDAFFKAMFSQPEQAAGELQLVLPAKLAARIDFPALTLCPGSFVDEALSRQHTDLLFSAPLAGRDAFFYLLFEHKSAPEALTAFQLLRYMVRIWDDFLKTHPSAKRLPAIIPVVLHHGEGGWSCARSFQELLDVDEEVLAELGEHVPRFRFLLDDLGLESDETLRQRAMSALGRLSLWCLRNARTPEQIVEGMSQWMGLVREVRQAPNGMAALVTIWRYVLLVGDRFGPEDLVARLLAAAGEDGKEEIVTAGEQLIERGRKEGLKEGLQQGQKKTLLRQLQARFGALPDSVLVRVKAAGSAELDLWADRILTAPTLEDVLGGA
jgi:hypothetical protein